MIRSIFGIICLVFLLAFPGQAHADGWMFVGTSNALGCDYYWVDDGDHAGTWNNANTANWSLSNGGASGAGPPTSADTVCFTSSSGGASENVTLSSTSASQNTYFAGAGSGNYNGTLTLPAATTWTISGGITMSSAMTFTRGNATTSDIKFASTSGTSYIDFAGKVTGDLIFDGVGGTWQFSSAVSSTASTDNFLQLVHGSLYTNNQALTTGSLLLNSTNIRTLDLGSSAITLQSSNNDTFITTTNLTFNSGTSSITATNGHDFNGGGLTWYDLTFNGCTQDLDGVNTFHNLSVSNTDSACTFQLFTNQTVTGTFTVAGFSASSRILFESDTFATTRTITAAATSLNGVDFIDITGAGAATWNGSGGSNYVGVCIGDTGITGTTPATRYWVGNGGSWSSTSHWSTSSGGSSGARVPICTDTAVFDSNSISSGSQTITMDLDRYGGINASAVTNNPVFAKSINIWVYGSLDMTGTTSSPTGGGDSRMRGSGSGTFDIGLNASATWPSGGAIVFENPGSTYRFISNFTSLDSLYSWMGTIDFNDYNMSFDDYQLSGTALARELYLGNGTLTATTTTCWQASVPTGLTIHAENSQIYCSIATGTGTFAGGNLTYYNLRAGTKSSGTLTISGSNAFHNITVDAPHSGFKFTAGTTQTVSNAFTCTGTSGNTITFTSTSGTNATLSTASTVLCDFITINDITGSGGGTFTATNATCSDATNWICTP